MNCNKADEYFMKYMDNCLTEEEARSVHKHLETCEKCAADFAVYDSIVKEFSISELIDAPDGLEELIMAKIKELPTANASVNKSINTLLMVASVSFFAILATGFIIFVNRDILIEFMSSYPSLAPYVALLTPVMEFVESLTGNAWQVITSATAGLLAVVNSFKYLILAAVVLLLAIQVVLHRRERDKVEE